MGFHWRVFAPFGCCSVLQDFCSPSISCNHLKPEPDQKCFLQLNRYSQQSFAECEHQKKEEVVKFSQEWRAGECQTALLGISWRLDLLEATVKLQPKSITFPCYMGKYLLRSVIFWMDHFLSTEDPPSFWYICQLYLNLSSSFDEAVMIKGW